jgi:hypothetical protein
MQQSHVTYLQQINRQASDIIKMTKAENAFYLQQLNWERVANTQLREELEIGKRLYQNAVNSNAYLEQEIITCKAACSATQQSLLVEKAMAEDMAAELDRTQRKFHLIDRLVDTMLLEEDSHLDINDRSRQITDVVLDLENQMERRYRTILRDKDERIARLEGQQYAATGRSQSAPRLG